MSTIKLTLLAAAVFTAPLALTIVYHVQSDPNAEAENQKPLLGKVLFFSSPG